MSDFVQIYCNYIPPSLINIHIHFRYRNRGLINTIIYNHHSGVKHTCLLIIELANLVSLGNERNLDLCRKIYHLPSGHFH